MVGPTPASWEVDPCEASATEEVPGVWRLRLPTAWEGIASVNAWAIERDDGLLLVDCGTAGHPSCRDALERAIGRTGHRIADVRVLAATHAHSDHIGLAAWVIEESGCRFLMHPAHAHLYDVMRDPRRFEAARAGRARREGAPERLLGAFGDVSEETDGVLAPVRPDGSLLEGDALESRIGPWRVLETPGHAPSHVCLQHAESRTLVLGDLVGPVFAPYYDYGYSADPVGEYLSSLERVAALEVEHALPGHGRRLRDFSTLLEEHRRGVEARLEAVRAAVARGPAPAYEVMVRAEGRPASPIAAVWRFVDVYCSLRHLRLAGEVVREVASDGTFRHRPA